VTASEEAGQELGPYTEVADTLIFAAVERAVLHEQEDEVLTSELTEHLGIQARALHESSALAATRRVTSGRLADHHRAPGRAVLELDRRGAGAIGERSRGRRGR
jgi:hypothetical protein